MISGLTTMLNVTSSVVSAYTCSGDPLARLSRVGDTDPSIEFSIGTHAYSAAPSRTASRAAGVLSIGSCRKASTLEAGHQAGGRHLQQSRLGEGPFGTEVSDAGHAHNPNGRAFPERALRHRVLKLSYSP